MQLRVASPAPLEVANEANWLADQPSVCALWLAYSAALKAGQRLGSWTATHADALRPRCRSR